MNSSRRDSNRSSSSRKKTHSRSKPSRNKKKHSQEKAENRSLDKHSNLRKEINLLHAEVSQLQSETSSLLGTNDTGRGEDNTIVPRKKSQDQLSLTISSTGHQTAFFAAAQQGDVSVLKIFIESNRANARDRDGENLTALHYAALSGRPAACRFLIEQGARVNTRGGDIDATPLQFAACYGYLNIIHLLISYGADPDVPDCHGYTALHVLVESSHFSVLSYLVRCDINIDARDDHGRTPLMWAAKCGNPHSLDLLLKSGASHAATDCNGLTPLHHAATSGSRLCVYLLVAANANESVKDHMGRTALDIARRRNTKSTRISTSSRKDIGNLWSIPLTFSYAPQPSSRPLPSPGVNSTIDNSSDLTTPRTYASEHPPSASLQNVTDEANDNVWEHAVVEDEDEDDAEVQDSLPAYHHRSRDITLLSGGPIIKKLEKTRCVPTQETINQDEVYHMTESQIFALLRDAIDSEAARPKLLRLRGECAETTLCLMQQILDGNNHHFILEANSKQRFILRRLLTKLSQESDTLPSCIFAEGVQCPMKDSIAVGGFADIFQGSYKGELIALKRLRVAIYSGANKTYRTAFARESLVWRQLKHGHILPFLGVDCSTFNGFYCMVSPWQQYGNIQNCISRLQEDNFPIPYDRWTLEIAEGLNYLHNESVVHGDLRGANVLIDSYLNVRLADFGLAIFADSCSASIGSHAGGASRWMSPELLGGEQRWPNFACDVFAFGRICIEIFTHRPPFHELKGECQVIAQILHLKRSPSRPTGDIGTVMSDALWSIVQDCWTEDPFGRPSAQRVVAKMRTLAVPEFMSSELFTKFKDGLGVAIAEKAV